MEICMCKTKKRWIPKVNVHLDCTKRGLCDPLPAMIIPWNIQYTFAGTDPLTSTFQAQGRFSLCGNLLESVSAHYLGQVSRPPTFSDLNGSSIQIPIPGVAGSMCSRRGCDGGACVGTCGKKGQGNCLFCDVEAYFFGQGEAAGDYTAILETRLCTSGNIVTCRVKKIVCDVDSDEPLDLMFVAVLRYITLPVQQNITNTFPLPTTTCG